MPSLVDCLDQRNPKCVFSLVNENRKFQKENNLGKFSIFDILLWNFFRSGDFRISNVFTFFVFVYIQVTFLVFKNSSIFFLKTKTIQTISRPCFQFVYIFLVT